MSNRRDRIYSCPVEATIDIIGGKWKPLIYYLLEDQPMRFGQLRKTLPGITQKMLTQHLREMEEDGIVLRTVYAEVPPKVEYSITEYGETLSPLLHKMLAWGLEHIKLNHLQFQPLKKFIKD
ncbi:MAG: helix-turn-helix domain-containing protein [Bacillota bacterium]|nr:helix-turn-helix domain-containing protein [Bacillota bacterium]